MQKENHFKFIEIAKCDHTIIQKFQQNNLGFSSPNQIFQGVLEIMIQMKSGVLMFRTFQGFMYGINPNDQVLYDDNDKQYKLVLCLDADPKATWIIKIQQNIQLIFFVLSERCKLIHRKAANAIITETQVCQEKSQKNKQVQVASKNIEKIRETDQDNQPTQKLLIETSKALGSTLKLVGKVIAKGLQYLGSFISKRVQPAQAIEVSDDTKKMIQTSVQASNKVLQITSEQFAAIFRVAKKQAIKISEKFEQSDKAKQLKQDGRIDKIKSGVKTGLNVVFNIYDGFSEGVTSAGKGLAKGSAEVVGAKYGKDAGEASYNIGKGAINVYKIVQVPKKQAKNVFKPEQQEDIKK